MRRVLITLSKKVATSTRCLKKLSKELCELSSDNDTQLIERDQYLIVSAYDKKDSNPINEGSDSDGDVNN